ncbi:type I restriction-modification system subunit M [Corynebacterium sputi]|uniref:type I restriction-modification system subunit M n=1 Tax=Corynebacterium sputi TaxID=489915 RepID=UPI000402E365|nr:class I SAM-dependent DNA methyltransferase [Corynebacterium sputi]
MTISQQHLESRLWSAANALRGPVAHADFMTYMFPMLFWKWISDTWTWEHEQAVADFGDALNDEIEADYHRFDLPEGTHWNDVARSTLPNLGTRIQKALDKIAQANAEKLAGIFGDAAWGNKERLPEEHLRNLISSFDGLNLNPDEVSHDMLGQAYEYLLKYFAEGAGQKAGEFFTPRQVVRLLVRLLDPQPEETIYDPTCGSGGMLMETINAIRARGEDHRTLRLYGQEVNLTTSAIARMNLYLHEIEDFKIVRGDTLRAPGLRNPNGTLQKFDVVIANPPFSLKNWGRDTWESDPRAFCGVPPKDRGDYAFIQHMISSMDEERGRVGVVMPLGALFRAGAEGSIRACLAEKDLLEAVIGLGSNLFYGAAIPVCLMIFRNEKVEERRNRVLFIDATERVKTGRAQNELGDDDMDAILKAFHEGEDPDGERGVNLRLVDLSEIEANGYDLNIGRYVAGAEAEAVDVTEALTAWQEARAERLAAEEAMVERLKAAGFDA